VKNRLTLEELSDVSTKAMDLHRKELTQNENMLVTHFFDLPFYT